MKKNMKLVVGTLGVASIFLACSNPTQAETSTNTPEISISEPTEISSVEQADETLGAEITFKTMEVNFGNIKEGESFEYDFEFTNTGTSDLVITSARGSCGCTVPEWPHEAIPAGKTGKIHVKFNSAGKSNQQTKTVTLQTNASPTPYTLYIKGFVDASH
jgi:Protein of unknown function (DUF1573)